MAEENKNNVKAKKPDPMELVSHTPFKDGKDYKDDIIVLFNGKKYTVKRGVKNMIPRCVLTIIRQSEQQKVSSNEFNEAQQNAFKESSRNI